MMSNTNFSSVFDPHDEMVPIDHNLSYDVTDEDQIHPHHIREEQLLHTTDSGYQSINENSGDDHSSVESNTAGAEFDGGSSVEFSASASLRSPAPGKVLSSSLATSGKHALSQETPPSVELTGKRKKKPKLFFDDNDDDVKAMSLYSAKKKKIAALTASSTKKKVVKTKTVVKNKGTLPSPKSSSKSNKKLKTTSSKKISKERSSTNKKKKTKSSTSSTAESPTKKKKKSTLNSEKNKEASRKKSKKSKLTTETADVKKKKPSKQTEDLAPRSYAKFVGMRTDEKSSDADNKSSSGKQSREIKTTFLLRAIPAVLGRETEKESSTSKKKFLPLIGAKRLSRRQAKIFWYDSCVEELLQGGIVSGRVRQYTDKKGKGKKDTDSSDEDDEEEDTKKSIIWAKGVEEKNKGEKYKSGFVIQCCGRNSIVVNKRTIKQGECAPLSNKSTLRIANYRLYFLLPLDVKPGEMTVPNPDFALDNHVEGTEKVASAVKRKRKNNMEGLEESSAKRKKMESNGTKSRDRRSPPIDNYDFCSLDLLFQKMNESIASNTWDRKDQMIGSAIAVRAVKDAAQSKFIRELAAKECGISRADVIEWIQKSKKYSKWATQMQSAMETKSYHTNIGKALIKSGYEKTGTMGRSVKWALPSPSPDEVTKVKEKSDEEDVEDGDEDDTGEEEDSGSEEEEGNDGSEEDSSVGSDAQHMELEGEDDQGEEEENDEEDDENEEEDNEDVANDHNDDDDDDDDDDDSEV